MRKPTRLVPLTGAALIAAALMSVTPAHAGTADDLRTRVDGARASAGCAPLAWTTEGATVAWYSSWINADYNIAHAKTSDALFAPLPPIDLHTNPQTDPIGALAAVNVTADRAVVIDQSGSRDRYAVDMLMGKAAEAIADCGYDTFGVGNFRNDNADLSSVAVALYTAHKEDPVTGTGADGIQVDDRAEVNPEIGREWSKSTATYNLRAEGLPWARINIAYLGDDNKFVQENNIDVTVGWSWTRTGKVIDAPWLTVSATSAGPAGLKLTCSVTSDSPTELVNGPSADKSGTIEFAGGITPQPAKPCG
ncbi:hypothetical protein [Mycolicibacterium brumae]|nr:hypothetical protein [Mycolicibacterium brumae]MCV7192415.1 hypothetical protein [Mycolicibacterium brumae]RWA18593.1 hypothetical protein MBRU_05060 [Mycolicibacterium brumae DSM 44177]UWW10183.1 hypothetical protein L2Z93_003309 [Mycolicibacterium brumae]